MDVLVFLLVYFVLVTELKKDRVHHECLECGGKILLQKVAIYLPTKTVSDIRTLQSSVYVNSGSGYSVNWQDVRAATVQESNFHHRQKRYLPEYGPKYQFCLLII